MPFGVAARVNDKDKDEDRDISREEQRRGAKKKGRLRAPLNLLKTPIRKDGSQKEMAKLPLGSATTSNPVLPL